MIYRHLFGPVPSRRLGLSLGVDLVPSKLCSFDCVYCECGRTTRLTTQRREYIPTEEVIAELRHFLAEAPQLDVITFSGNGEPTLHTGLSQIITFIRSEYPAYKVAVLTNGSLLSDASVRRELATADIVIPSLDAVREETLQRINRPASGIELPALLHGLAEFRIEFKGEIWLELFIIPGLNDSAADLARLQELLPELAPDRIQLNSLDRPGSESWVKAADYERLQELARQLNGEVIARQPKSTPIAASSTSLHQRTVELISRRPCTVTDLCSALGATPAAITTLLQELESSGKLLQERQQRGIFYRWQGDRAGNASITGGTRGKM